MMEALSRLLCALGLPAFFRWRNRRRLLILMYHGVREEDLVPFCWHTLAAPRFRRQMAWVARRYRVLPLSEALAKMKEGTLPPRACAITFDDGFENVATVAGPILAEHRLPATVFLVTGAIGDAAPLWPDRLWLAFARTTQSEVDLTGVGLGRFPLHSPEDRSTACRACSRSLKALPKAEKDARLDAIVEALGRGADAEAGPLRLMTWDQVKALGADGRVRFGPHTVTHDILSRLPDDEVVTQVRRSQEDTSSRLGYVPDVFAYPNGGAHDFDERSRAAVRSCGIPWALSTLEGLDDAETDPLALRRMGVGADLSFARFRLLVSGALLALRGAPVR